MMRRAYTRAVFAAVEGISNHFKLQVLDETDAPINQYHLSIAEIAMLKEESYAVNGKGKAYAQSRFIRTEDNLVFALRMYMRDYGLACEIDRSGAGWQAFKAALQVRHRVTHPRCLADLMIEDTEIAIVKSAHEWFIQTIITNMKLVNTHLQKQLNDLPDSAM